jgi:hypothetical protein
MEAACSTIIPWSINAGHLFMLMWLLTGQDTAVLVPDVKTVSDIDGRCVGLLWSLERANAGKGDSRVGLLGDIDTARAISAVPCCSHAIYEALARFAGK